MVASSAATVLNSSDYVTWAVKLWDSANPWTVAGDDLAEDAGHACKRGPKE